MDCREKVHYKRVPVLIMQLAIDILSTEQLYELNRYLFYEDNNYSDAVKPYVDKIQSYWETLEESKRNQQRGLKQNQQRQQTSAPQRKSKSIIDELADEGIKPQNKEGYDFKY